jgi:hypothetical protein
VNVLPIEKRSEGCQLATTTTGPLVTPGRLQIVLSRRITGPKLPTAMDCGFVVSRIVLPSTVMLAGLAVPSDGTDGLID